MFQTVVRYVRFLKEWVSPAPAYYNTEKIIRIITFTSYSSHIKIIFNQLNILPSKRLLFLRIGLQMFKYESGQLPDALNMFFVKNRSEHNYNTQRQEQATSYCC